jgi:hypothetical protein
LVSFQIASLKTLVLVVGSPTKSLFMWRGGKRWRWVQGKRVTLILIGDFGMIWARKLGHLEFRSQGKWGRTRKMNT